MPPISAPGLNDGDLDIFQGAAFPGPQGQFRSFMLLNLGGGQFLDVTDGLGLAAAGPLNILYSRLRDIDNDGDLDLSWDGRDDSGGELASGAYLYRLRTEDQVATRKLLLLK